MKYDIEDIKRLLRESKHNYTIHSWFFPSDILYPSTALKYTCKKLYEKGILERSGDSRDRWGYTYRIKEDK